MDVVGCNSCAIKQYTQMNTSSLCSERFHLIVPSKCNYIWNIHCEEKVTV